MKRVLGLYSAVLLSACLVTAPVSADPVYRAGATVDNGGYSVNSYTNVGAANYRHTMRSSRSGRIYNLAPKPVKKAAPPLSKLKIPGRVSFDKSLGKELGDRYVGNGSSRVNLSKIIKKKAKKYNLDPMLVEEVIRQESNFQNRARSYVGAQGLMQLMPSTARMMGVRNTSDPAQNVEGGCRYLALQLTKFGRLDYALAAYNAGPGAVQKYGGVPPYRETRNYVRKIVNSYNNRVKDERKRKKKSKKN